MPACVAENTLRHIEKGGDLESAPGTSVLPIFPIMPICFWGLALLLDIWLSPWGFRVIFALHALYGIFLVRTLVIFKMRINRLS